MMRPGVPLLLFLLAIPVSPAASARAQALPLQRGPDSTMKTFVPGIDVLPFPGLPFSGTDKIVWTRPLEGGGSVSSYEEAKVVRDGQGRLYRERHHFAPANVDPESTLYEFYIQDPVSRTSTVCDRATRLCHITNYKPRFSFAAQAVGSFDQGRQYLTRESLGAHYIGDLSAAGTLERTTISPGTIGNDQILTLSREFWYSADIKANLSVTRKDPRQGTQAITLSILSRSEPDPSIFAVPSGYRIEDDRHPLLPPN